MVTSIYLIKTIKMYFNVLVYVEFCMLEVVYKNV
jgi:hypothetical protein